MRNPCKVTRFLNDKCVSEFCHSNIFKSNKCPHYFPNAVDMSKTYSDIFSLLCVIIIWALHKHVWNSLNNVWICLEKSLYSLNSPNSEWNSLTHCYNDSSNQRWATWFRGTPCKFIRNIIGKLLFLKHHYSR